MLLFWWNTCSPYETTWVQETQRKGDVCFTPMTLWCQDCCSVTATVYCCCSPILSFLCYCDKLAILGRCVVGQATRSFYTVLLAFLLFWFFKLTKNGQERWFFFLLICIFLPLYILLREHSFLHKNAISPLGGTDAVTPSAACIYSEQTLACPTNFRVAAKFNG